tara:strand:- start:13 stop:1089 length:1077 start_codon:yes stop_codon:yes gene_type:complete
MENIYNDVNRFYKSKKINSDIWHIIDSLFSRNKTKLRFNISNNEIISNEDINVISSPVREVNDSGNKFLIDNKYDNEPLVIRNALSNWKVSQLWSIDYILNNYGNDLNGLGKIKDIIKQRKQNYVQFHPIFILHPSEINNINLDYIYKNTGTNYVIEAGFQFFMSNVHGTKTLFHNANDSNLFMQISGKKEWIFYPPDMNALIEPSPKSSHRKPNINIRNHDPFECSTTFNNRFNYSNCLKVTLNEGDILYVPPYYWHAVKTITSNNISIGYRWLDPINCLNINPIYFLLDLVSGNPNIIKNILINRKEGPMRHFINEMGLNHLYSREKFKKYLLELYKSSNIYTSKTVSLKKKYKII